MPDSRQQVPWRAQQRAHEESQLLGSVRLSGTPGTVIPAGFALSVHRLSGGSRIHLVTADPVIIPPRGSVDGVRVQRAPLFGEGLVSRTLRHSAMNESFRASYGWHNNPDPPLLRPPSASHHQPHIDRSVATTFPPVRRVEFPLFEISSNPTINLSAIRERRFDVFDRGDARPAMIPAVELLLRGLTQAFTQPQYITPPLPPELPRRSRYEVLAA